MFLLLDLALTPLCLNVSLETKIMGQRQQHSDKKFKAEHPNMFFKSESMPLPPKHSQEESKIVCEAFELPEFETDRPSSV